MNEVHPPSARLFCLVGTRILAEDRSHVITLWAGACRLSRGRRGCLAEGAR